ncbi:hypothetical protein RJT34_19416 [Clitoria ternatea]|uniref:Uncharacterized protein n=1 Tax=Clitoria ternatea TaxID=43366 RepID=A0AAN9IR88_CLITE
MAKENITKHMKVPFNEEDVATLLERYDATTVLTLLQELANYQHSKFDWNKLVAKSSTGITDPAEYRRLWRHLAYRHSLTQNSEDDAQPLDDDSDLECDQEALSPEAMDSISEASACVQVMIASHEMNQATPTSSVIPSPLTITIPNRGTMSEESSQPSNLIIQEKTFIFPVTVKRKTLPNTLSTRTMKANGSDIGSTSTKKKRATWSEEEDMLLREAVQRWGEGHWAEMAKREDFPIKKSTSQMSKRWSTLRKKDGGNN